jgi:hypothetical protein
MFSSREHRLGESAQLLETPRKFGIRHESALALDSLEAPFVHQRIDGFTYGRTAETVQLLQVTLGRDSIANLVSAALDGFQNRFAQLFV